MTSASSHQPADQANFVFKGTVKKLKASTMPNVPVTNRTAIVHVDQVIQAPKTLSSSEGQDITVQLSKGERLKAGKQAIFYTNGWLFGDSIAVQSSSHTEIVESRAAISSASPLETKANRDLREHLVDADIVVRGKVVSVGLPEAPATRSGKSRNAKADSTTRVSEHSPKWNEAIVDVESVEKGRRLKKRIAVRFPQSNDVAWARAPKLDPGQEGVFLLHKPAGETHFVVRHANDFLPSSKVSEVRSLIQSTSATKSSKRTR